MRMVIVYKQGTLGFSTTKRISVRSIFLNNPKLFTVPQQRGTVNQSLLNAVTLNTRNDENVMEFPQFDFEVEAVIHCAP